MAFGIFMHRADAIYDDIPSVRYQFPKMYLTRAQQCEGDWIIYLEPRNVKNTKGYFAVAKVQEIIPDPRLENMYLAIIEPGSYLDFGDPVSFRIDGRVIERGVLNDEGNISGRAQAAVRTISPEDFSEIIELGLGRDETLPREDHKVAPGFSDTPQTLLHGLGDRGRELTSRAARDYNFRKAVLRAYGEQCAITGYRFINGGGRVEAKATHIKPLEHNGPNIVSNGIALSRTARWMFDHGILSLTDDLKIMVSRQSNDPDAIQSIINKTGALLTPQRLSEHPRTEFVTWHREHRFKQ